MSTIIKRIMHGTEVIGYVTDDLDLQYKYINKRKAMELANNHYISNLKVTRNAEFDTPVLRGCNGTNLNDLERLNINIENIENYQYDNIESSQDLLIGLVELRNSINAQDIMNAIYNKINEFINQNNLKFKKDDAGISVLGSIDRENNMCNLRLNLSWDGGIHKPSNNLIIWHKKASHMVALDLVVYTKEGNERTYSDKFREDQIKDILSKLDEYLVFIKNNTYQSYDEAIKDFIQKNGGKTPQIIEAEKNERMYNAWNSLHNIYKKFRESNELVRFANSKGDKVSEINSTKAGDCRDIALVYEYNIKWRQRGYRDIFILKFMQRVEFDCGAPYSVITWAELVGEQGSRKKYILKYKDSGKSILLEKLDENKINYLGHYFNKIMTQAISDANQLKDKSNNDIIRGWFKR